jgi:hypothetical protein
MANTVQVKTLLFRLKTPVLTEQLLLKFTAPPSVIPVVFVDCILMDMSDKLPDVVAVPPPEFPSNMAASATPGADAPEAPPDVADQFVVLALSHVPVPPTQNLFAIVSPSA